MKTIFKMMIMALVLFSCSNEQIEPETADAKAKLPSVENSNSLFYDDGKPLEMKIRESDKAYGQKIDGRKGKGKPQRSVHLKPSILNNSLRILATGRIMEEPIEYTGDLTVSETVDWDNDGILDEVVLNQRCYFPRTFVELSVNGEIVSYSATYYAKILGFKDVDLDGYQDVIFEGSSANAFNNGEPYRPYNVGFNRAGALPMPLKDIIQSLVIDTSDPNPEYVKWDLSDFGYHNFVFHVFLYNKNLNDGYGYEQTTTYGEFGFYSLNRITRGDVYVLRFTNLGDDCSNVEVRFTL